MENAKWGFHCTKKKIKFFRKSNNGVFETNSVAVDFQKSFTLNISGVLSIE